MRSNEERIRLMHLRANEIRKKRDKAILAACGALNLCLCVALISIIASVSGSGAIYTGSPYTGASLFDTSVVGGYVLTALIAFMAGVVTTVMIKKGLQMKREEKSL